MDRILCGLRIVDYGLWIMDRIVWTGQQDTGLTDVKKCLAVSSAKKGHGPRVDYKHLSLFPTPS
jgi:hypothetical protein